MFNAEIRQENSKQLASTTASYMVMCIEMTHGPINWSKDADLINHMVAQNKKKVLEESQQQPNYCKEIDIEFFNICLDAEVTRLSGDAHESGCCGCM